MRPKSLVRTQTDQPIISSYILLSVYTLAVSKKHYTSRGTFIRVDIHPRAVARELLQLADICELKCDFHSHYLR